MTKTELAWTKCLSLTLSDEALLSCAECRAYEYRKCDGCPASEFTIRAGEPQDPMDSIRMSRWIDVLNPNVPVTAFPLRFDGGELIAIQATNRGMSI